MATIGARKTIAPTVRDYVAAVNGRDLLKSWDAPKVGMMTAGSPAERGKQFLRWRRTHATAEQEKQKAKPNSKEAEHWAVKTYVNKGPKLGKKRSQFQ
jgi:hypothetical protein